MSTIINGYPLDSTKVIRSVLLQANPLLIESRVLINISKPDKLGRQFATFLQYRNNWDPLGPDENFQSDTVTGPLSDFVDFANSAASYPIESSPDVSYLTMLKELSLTMFEGIVNNYYPTNE